MFGERWGDLVSIVRSWMGRLMPLETCKFCIEARETSFSSIATILLPLRPQFPPKAFTCLPNGWVALSSSQTLEGDLLVNGNRNARKSSRQPLCTFIIINISSHTLKSVAQARLTLPMAPYTDDDQRGLERRGCRREVGECAMHSLQIEIGGDVARRVIC